ncbi:hypothetical protein ACVILH_004908 [Bradyrhizobium sp. USDA 4353]
MGHGLKRPIPGTTKPRIPGLCDDDAILNPQCEDSAGDPASGWISAAIMPLEPGP